MAALTRGAFVSYYPALSETGIHPDDPDQPFVAIVCDVQDAPEPAPTNEDDSSKKGAKTPAPPQLVNLAVFDYRGMYHARQDVPLVTVGKDGPPARPYCSTETYVKKEKKDDEATAKAA